MKLFIFSVAFVITDILFYIKADYEYSKEYESYWDLSVKASSLSKKIEGIDKFVGQLEKSGLQGKHNALFLETPNNSFDENFQALKSLQIRLHEIEHMNIKSFEYQTALQQITQQEQNEADGMLHVFSGVWCKDNYFFLWDWIGITQILGFVILSIIGVTIWIEESY